MPTKDLSKGFPVSLGWAALWLATIALTVAIYWPGLSGDFLFDDYPHIVRNELIRISSLSPENLWQAWNSSAFDFPNSRPLAMLTFGVTHVFSGLDPSGFKATNLALHILTGIVLFAVSRRIGALYLECTGRTSQPASVRWWAWLTAALWLVHPLNLTPVLLSVQRMTILATLLTLLGMLVYLVGRQRMADSRRGGLLLVWLSPAVALIGLTAKESALLLPILLFVTEWTLFRFKGLDTRATRHLKLFFLLGVAVPLAVVAVYLAFHPNWIVGGYGSRPFTLEERLLTEARILWFYVQLIIAPSVDALGIFHDDIALSRGLLEPWTTLVATAAWAAVIALAVAARRRLPLVAFAVLFFVAGHLMESTAIALELVFEHRNYLPMFGILFALASVPTLYATRIQVSPGLLRTLAAVVLIAFSVSTATRAHDWSSHARLILAEVDHHPNSPRANFAFAQVVMTVQADELKEEVQAVAKQHMERIGQVDSNMVNGLFGLVVIELMNDRLPPPDLIDTLAERLRTIPFSPINITIEHFYFLVELQQRAKPENRLPKEQLLSLFEAALANPTLPQAGRPILYHALRGYYLYVVRDAKEALRYAELAVKADPSAWDLRDRKIRLLAAMKRWDEADAALAEAIEMDRLGLYKKEANNLAEVIALARRGEAVPAKPAEKRL